MVMKKLLLSVFLATGSLMMFSCGGGTSSKNNLGSTNSDESVTELKTNDLKKEGLNSKVKSVRQRVYWASEKFGRIEKGKLQKIRSQDYLKEYDNNGFLTQETYFDVRDSVISSRKIIYAKSGQIEKEELFDGNKLSSSVNYIYEKNVLQQKEIFDASGKLKERYAYSYYDIGLLMDEDKYNANNQLVQKTVHLYNTAKLLIEKQYYWGGGSSFKKEELIYDIDDNLKSVSSYKYVDKEAVFDGNITYLDYNEKGDYQLREIFNKENNKIEINEYVYDKFGNLTESSVSKLVENKVVEAKVAENEETVENEEDTVTTESNIPETEINESEEWVQGTGASYEYLYDEKNNWTRKISYKIEPEVKPARQYYYDRLFIYY
jgi:hypothetical protein